VVRVLLLCAVSLVPCCDSCAMGYADSAYISCRQHNAYSRRPFMLLYFLCLFLHYYSVYQVLNAIYGSVAIALNDYENHRTDTQYEDALIAKTFIFQYVNSFASLFYISFVKPYMQVRYGCSVRV
jgi:hypothetical protein